MLVLNWPKELLLHSMIRKTAYYADLCGICQSRPLAAEWFLSHVQRAGSGSVCAP